jgi:hypothetical protein
LPRSSFTSLYGLKPQAQVKDEMARLGSEVMPAFAA